MSNLREASQEYLQLRRNLGCKLRGVDSMLRSFVDCAERENASSITTDLALRWARQPQHAQPATWAWRLRMVRRFALWLSASDPRTEVPPAGLLPHRYARKRPYIYRDAEIQKLAKQVRDLQTLLEKDGVTMAENDRRNKERDLANMSRDLQRGQREFREDLNLRRNEELSAVQERANKVINQIAIDEKFDLIIQDPVIYASQRIDITDRVIKALADK